MFDGQDRQEDGIKVIYQPIFGEDLEERDQEEEERDPHVMKWEENDWRLSLTQSIVIYDMAAIFLNIGIEYYSTVIGGRADEDEV